MIEDNILKDFKNKSILITGGTGLIGRQIVDVLCNADAFVYIVSLDKVKVNDRANHIYGDLTDFNFCKDVTQDIEYVFHIAGIKGSIEVTKSKPSSFFVPLLMMNTNILEACRINKVEKVVYTSSIGAYSNAEIFKEEDNVDSSPPMDLFPGWAKRIAEMQIQAYKIQYNLKNFAIVRPCNVYGPGDNFDPNNAMVIPSLMYRILMFQKCKENNKEKDINNKENKEKDINNKENKEKDINNKELDPVTIWGDGSAIRDFAYSKDIAEGIIQSLYYGTNESPTGFVNLGSGIGYTIKELIETLHSFLDFDYKFDTTKSSGFPKRVMDISLARKMIRYNPTTSLLDGLKETWNWFINNQDEYLKKINYFESEKYDTI